MKATEKNIEIIVQELQRGAEVQIGGSRYHRYYGYKAGGWYSGIFDEGYRMEDPTTREEIINRIKDEFSEFRSLLKRPHARAIGFALRNGDHDKALKHLDAWELIGDSRQEAPVLRAYLEWPSGGQDEKTIALIRDKILDQTAYHVLMGFLNFEETEENGHLGLLYLKRLIRIAGECPRWRRLRATFREMSGNIAAAIADLQDYLGNLPKDYEFERPHLEKRILELQKRLEI